MFSGFSNSCLELIPGWSMESFIIHGSKAYSKLGVNKKPGATISLIAAPLLRFLAFSFWLLVSGC